MEVEIVRPSPAQMRKLHMGHPFRAKLGPGLKVMVPSKEAKKMMKASMKGAGATLSGCRCSGCGMCGGGVPPQFDPRLQGGNVIATAKDSGKRLMVAGTDRAVRALEGSGNVKKTIRTSAKRLLESATDRAIRALEGSGSGMNPFVKVQRKLDKKRAQEMKEEKQAEADMKRKVVSQMRKQAKSNVNFGGNVKATAKDSAKRLMEAGTDRAVRALEGSSLMSSLRQDGVARANAQSSPAHLGGKVNRRKKFNKWFKAIGDKFKPIAKNVKPIKEAATQRIADVIKYYDNPEAQAQLALDMFQKEAGETADVFRKDKKRGQSQGSASVADYVPAPSYAPVVPAGLRRGTFISPPSAPASPPQAVDVNDDGEPDGYFYPNEMTWFGAGIPSGMKGMQGVRKTMRRTAKKAQQMGGMMGRPTTMPVVKPRPSLKGSGSPWIQHVKAYCAQHGCKYSEGLKRAGATYKKGGALYPAGYDPRYDR